MRRLLALLLALVSPVPTAAQDGPQIDGVWEGTIGSSPVVACFMADGQGRSKGSYYYRRYLTPIPLSGDREIAGRWEEYNDTGSWQISAAGKTIHGEWSHGTRRLPIRLRPVAWTEPEEDWLYGACASREFQAPRAFAPEVERADAQKDGWHYRRLEWIPPEHLKDNGITSFEFDPVEPGDDEVLGWLRAQLPSGRSDDEFMRCMAQAISSTGLDGYSEHFFEPAFANRNFIAVRSGNSVYCGGAHPAHWMDLRTFDRQSGEELDVSRMWFAANGFATNEYDSWIIQPDLRTVVMQHYLTGDVGELTAEDAEHEAVCTEYVSTIDFWQAGLTDGGIGFIPSVAYALTPCADTIEVPWEELEPFLSPEGRIARERAAR